ncbi:MAG: hypothetical protein HYW49_00175 [Deltaproteobacteria bacterium]|nr:hypothetical protein [Deltaproteobacteria bacterium]
MKAPIQIILTCLCLSLVGQSAFARAKRAHALELYAATENDGTAHVIMAGHPIDEPSLESDAPAPKPEPKAAKPSPKKSAAKPETSTAAFDVVPRERVEELSERVKYSYEILKRFGRAYDYKTVTLKEFKSILKELEASTGEPPAEKTASEK